MRHSQESIEKIRSFNRFYTNVIGLLDQHYLDSPFSLTEGRVLYEIVHSEDCSAKKIRANVSIDEGYLSRIIDKFMRQGLIKKSPAPEDRRLQIIVVTEKGQKEFSKLNENSNESISQVVESLSPAECEELVAMMERIHELLNREAV